jgi:hypothetical protein
VETTKLRDNWGSNAEKVMEYRKVDTCLRHFGSLKDIEIGGDKK